MARGQTSAVKLDGSSAGFIYESIPDTCPVCHTSIFPKLLGSFFTGDNDSSIEITFQCTKNTCHQIFIGRYVKTQTSSYYGLLQVVPNEIQNVKFSEEINSVSPTFVEVYNQVIIAESEKLNHLVGIGLRKAIEFLIKDFLIRENSKDKDHIEHAFLMSCMEKYIDDENLKQCAKRAIWLGNDETHYIRKWEEKDIEDLKVLVRLSVNWIERILLTRKYIKSMPDKK